MSNILNTAFIIGTGRCGTTLLGQMLNSHSAICVPPELQLIFECNGNGNRLLEEFANKGPDDFSAEKLSLIIERCCPYKLELFFDYKIFCHSIDLSHLTPSKFLFDFYLSIAKSFQKSWLIEQTPWYGQRIDLLVKFFPQAKFIHMVRDGRDVALSFTRTPWGHKTVHLNLGKWAREIKKISVDASVYLEASNYLVVNYENLVTNPEYELRRICNFLGVNFETSMCDASKFIVYDSYSKFEVEEVSSMAYKEWKKERASPVFSSNVQAWRRKEYLFSCKFTDDINNALRWFGYPTSDQKNINTEQYYFDISSYASGLEEKIANLNQAVAERDGQIASLSRLIGEIR